MLSIQECVTKTESQRRNVKEFMQENGYFDAQECNIYEGLKRSVQRELQETLRKLSLKELLFSPGGLSTGYQAAKGAHYLVPTWLSQKLYTVSNQVDIVPLISADVFEPRGSECNVPVGLLIAQQVGQAGLPDAAALVEAPTITLEKFVVGSPVTEEMIEDNEFGLVEWTIQRAGEALGRKASDYSLNVLETATDGYGTTVATAGAAAETLPNNIFDCVELVSNQDINVKPICNTMVINPEAWSHSVATDGTAAYFPTGINTGPPAPGFHLKFHMLDTVFSSSTELCTWAVGGAVTACETVVFDRTQAMVTARKNWLRVENYANPVEDLAGAVITGRQDSVTVVDAAIGTVTET